MLEVLQRLLVELQILVERVLKLRQLHQVQLREVDRLHLSTLVGHDDEISGNYFTLSITYLLKFIDFGRILIKYI